MAILWPVKSPIFCSLIAAAAFSLISLLSCLILPVAAWRDRGDWVVPVGEARLC